MIEIGMKSLVVVLILLTTPTTSETQKNSFRATANSESFKELECINSVQFLLVRAERIEGARSRACDILFPSQEPDIDQPREQLPVIEPKFLKKLLKRQPQASIHKYLYGGTSSEQTIYSIPLDLKSVPLDDGSITMASPGYILNTPSYLIEASTRKVKHPDYSLLIDDDCSIRGVLMKVYRQGCLPNTPLTPPWSYELCTVTNGEVDRRRKYYPSIPGYQQLPSDSMRIESSRQIVSSSSSSSSGDSTSSRRISRSRRFAGSLGSGFSVSSRRSTGREKEPNAPSLRFTDFLPFRGWLEGHPQQVN